MSISVCFALALVIFTIANDISTRRAAYKEAANFSARQMAEYTDFRLATALQDISLIRLSNDTSQYVRKAESVQYNRLKMYTFLRGIYGAAPVDMSGLAVSTFEENHVIRADGTGFVSTFLNMFGMNAKQLEELFVSFSDSYISQTSFLRTSKNAENVCIMVRYEPIINQIPLYIFISFTEAQLFNTAREGSGALFFNDKLIARTGRLSEEQFEALNEGATIEGIYVQKLNSSVTGYRYIYAERAFSPFEGGVMVIISIGILGVAATMTLSVYLARKLYAPVRELVTLTGGTGGADEFDFIKNAMREMQEEAERLSGSIKQYDKMLENAFYTDLLNGTAGIAKPKTISAPLQGPFAVVLIRYNPLSEGETEFDQNMLFILKQKLIEYLRPLISSLPFYKNLDISFDTNALILPVNDEKSLKETLNDALLQAESEFNLDFTAVIGCKVIKLTDIYKSYREAKRCLETGQDIWGAKVITSDKAVVPSRPYFPLNTEQELARALMKGVGDIWKPIIDDIISVNRDEQGISAAQLAEMFAVCINRVADALRIDLEADGQSLLKSEDYKSLECSVTDVLKLIADCVQAEKKKPDSAMTEKMLQFVEDNYNRDIGLLDLAEHLNLSKNYVSTLFKSAVGSNFKDFLNKTRYQKACLILEEDSGKKIKDVAELVGCNKDILARLFKRYSGAVPSDFKATQQTNK